MLQYILIAFGGSLGSLARYYLSNSLLKNFIFFDFPVAILAVNILGSFVFGIIMGIIENNLISENIKNFLLFGFLAAFTTFSTFAWEAITLIHSEMYIKLIMYCLLSVSLSVIFCLIGYHLGK
jgi:CrcB protein|tara:strand:- start:12979 stop:13347 length:369 start_codon:yes stop_codon:yes gene_type:complete